MHAVFRPQLVVLDLSVLVANYPNAQLNSAVSTYRLFGMSIDREHASLVLGRPARLGLKLVHREIRPDAVLDPRQLDEMIRVYRKEVQRYFQYSPMLAVMPNVIRTLEAIRSSGMGVALISDLDRDAMQTLMTRLGWWGTALFDGVLALEDMPKAQGLEELMLSVGVERGVDVVYAGLCGADVEAGRQANCGRVFLVDMGCDLIGPDEERLCDGVLMYCDELLPELFGSVQEVPRCV